MEQRVYIFDCGCQYKEDECATITWGKRKWINKRVCTEHKKGRVILVEYNCSLCGGRFKRKPSTIKTGQTAYCPTCREVGHRYNVARNNARRANKKFETTKQQYFDEKLFEKGRTKKTYDEGWARPSVTFTWREVVGEYEPWPVPETPTLDRLYNQIREVKP